MSVNAADSARIKKITKHLKMKHLLKIGFTSVLIVAALSSLTAQRSRPLAGFELQAHRGGRGLMPENTLQSEKNAVDLGTTLEMDLQLSKDLQVVVSHDGYFNADFSLTPEGAQMTKKEGVQRILFNMPYDSIKKYDVGSKPHPGFARQHKLKAYRPLLSELIDSVEAYSKTKGHVNHYNIEIKSSPKADGLYYPSLDFYISQAMQVIKDKGIASRTLMQSFDVRALKILHESYPDMPLSYLVTQKNSGTAEHYINLLGFTPQVFSPEYSIVTPEMVADFHALGIKVIPWTVNELADMRRLKDMGVDGLISDYPDLYQQLK